MIAPEYVLPYPPSANRYWRVFRGRAVKSAEARKYQKDVRTLYRHAQPMPGQLIVQLRIYRPAKRRDLDNHFKVVLDALQGVAYENDSQIVELNARMTNWPGNGHVVVRVYPTIDYSNTTQEFDASDYERP